MHPTIQQFESARMKTQKFDFRPGDTVRVSVRIVEGEKERLQDFEGICISRKGGGIGETFTVRRVSYGVGMERVFPIHSPRIEKVLVMRRGKVRRAKLNYLRDRQGKRARVTEDLLRSRKMAQAAKANKALEEKAAAAAASKAQAEEEAKAAEAEAQKAEEAPAEQADPQADETPAAEEKPAE